MLVAFSEDSGGMNGVALVVSSGRRPVLAAVLSLVGMDEERNIFVGFSVTGFSA